ncbi:hypothetical protein [Kitasatospora sp. NBC_01302]|uniref:hypothetical protein n=1 Tax=Kitasatospora sp. NBC_01302 TaxID=2903575 RepID=UPI002E0EFC28|nr:hypothetical protein OG294_13700 [Kitasatospora sp. NBC_01302]
MTGRRDALTELVCEQVGPGRTYSVRTFAERAVDPATGYSPGKSLIGKIIKRLSYTVSPELVSALAVGLGKPRELVAQAAAEQFIGITISGYDTDGVSVRVAHEGSARPQTAPRTQEFIDSVLGRGEGSDT